MLVDLTSAYVGTLGSFQDQYKQKREGCHRRGESGGHTKAKWKALKKLYDYSCLKCVLMDVYSPVRPAREAGTERRLPLEGVPGSVEMINRCHFNPVHSRWIDEWIPVEEPDNALVQTIRCYTPSDFLLLLEGIRLKVEHVEVEGQVLNVGTKTITISNLWMDSWCYLIQLKAYN